MSPTLPDSKYGISVKAATVPPGSPYWRITEVYHLTGNENGGNHHAYCEVLDETGKRVKGARLKLSQAGQPDVFAVIDKPDNEAGTNFPLWSENLASVTVIWPQENPYPSDTVEGIRTSHPDEEPGNTWGHHSFLTTWQLTKAGTDPDDDPPTDEPAPSPGFKVQAILHDDERIRLTQVVWVKPSKTLSADAEAVALAMALEAHKRDHPIEAYQRELRKKVEEEGGEG